MPTCPPTESSSGTVAIPGGLAAGRFTRGAPSRVRSLSILRTAEAERLRELFETCHELTNRFNDPDQRASPLLDGLAGNGRRYGAAAHRVKDPGTASYPSSLVAGWPCRSLPRPGSGHMAECRWCDPPMPIPLPHWAAEGLPLAGHLMGTPRTATTRPGTWAWTSLRPACRFRASATPSVPTDRPGKSPTWARTSTGAAREQPGGVSPGQANQRPALKDPGESEASRPTSCCYATRTVTGRLELPRWVALHARGHSVHRDAAGGRWTAAVSPGSPRLVRRTPASL